DEILRLGNPALDVGIGDLFRRTGQGGGRGGGLRAELADRNRHAIVGLGQLPVPGDDTPRLVALRRTRGGRPAQGVQRPGHVVDPFAVQPDAVRRPQVLHPDLAVDLADLGVAPGHRAVLHRDVALIRAADRHRDRAHRVRLLDSAWTLHDEVRGYSVEERGIDHLGFRSCFFAHGALSHGARAWKRVRAYGGAPVRSRIERGWTLCAYLPG